MTVDTHPVSAVAAPLASRRRLMTLGAVGLLAAAALLFSPSLGGQAGAATLPLILGGIVLGALLRLTPPASLWTSVDSSVSHERGRRHWWAVALGAALLAVVTFISARMFVFLFPQGMSHHLQFALMVLAGGLIVWGLRGTETAPAIPFTARPELLALAALTGLALVLRLWQLGETVHFMVDELNFALGVSQFWARPNIELITPRVMSFTGLYSYWQALSVEVLGRTLFGLRFVSAVAGALTVPALWGLARTLFDRPTALLAALLLAVFPPHLHFSRLGINNVADPLFGTLALMFLARSLHTGRRLDYALAGVLLGMTQYFYEGGRVVFPALVILWVGWIALAGERGSGSRPLDWRGLGLMALAAVVVALPVYVTLIAVGAPLLTRINDQGLESEFWWSLFMASADEAVVGAFLRHLVAPLLFWFHRIDSSLFYAGSQPLLLVYLAPAFLLGMWTAVWQPRQRGLSLLLLWVLLVWAGNTLLKSPTESPRFVAAFPAVMLLCAVGLRQAWALLMPAPVARRVKLAAGALIALAAIAQVAYYFGPHLALFNVQFRADNPAPDAQDAILRAADLPYGTHVHLISDPPYADVGFLNGLAGYLSDGLRTFVLKPDEVTPQYMLNLSRNVDHAFFVEPDDTATVEFVRQFFDLRPPERSPYPLPPDEELLLYFAPREDARRSEP